MQAKSDTQLVIGPYESANFSREEILDRIKRYVEAVPTRRLIIWNNQGDQWFERLVKLCDVHHLEPYLWYPVLADRMDKSLPDTDELVRSATWQSGYGELGLWDGFVGNDENFLFRCPEHSIDGEEEGREIATTLSRFGFTGVFLDRIRYPSPANGLEMLFSCFCQRCLETGLVHQHRVAEQAVECMVAYCLEGHAMDWPTFVQACGLGDLMERRARAITEVVKTITGGVDRSRFSVGLDLLSPALAPLVGQDYGQLSVCSDWVKAMTYTRAIGLAGLPLEARSMVTGLQEAHREIGREKASRFVEGLLGLPIGSMEDLYQSGGFSVDVLRSEISCAQRSVRCGVPVVAGVELVDHPVFPTRITAGQADSMIAATEATGTPVITCWNLLYIPKENYRSLMR